MDNAGLTLDGFHTTTNGRRRFLDGAAGAFVVFLAAGMAWAPPRSAAAAEGSVQTKESQAAMTPEKALQLLREGNARFVAGSPERGDRRTQVRQTAAGQYPFAAILSCMDSRGPVEMIFDVKVGDVFSLRVAGNVVNTDVLGSLEYATKVAGAKLILVLGHTRCGAVKGAIDGVKLGNLTDLLAKIEPAVGQAGAGSSTDDVYVDLVAEKNVRHSIRLLTDGSTILRDLAASGAIALAGAVYDIGTGKVKFLPGETRTE